MNFPVGVQSRQRQARDENLVSAGNCRCLFARLHEDSLSLPKRLRQCAALVLLNPERIAVSTVSEFAEMADVQPSAVVRFCQVLGFSGFSQMQQLFREAYTQRQWPDYASRLELLRSESADSPAALLGEFVSAGRLSLDNLLNSLDIGDLEASVNLIADADVIHVAGFRRSMPVSTYLAYAFEKLGAASIHHSEVGRIGSHQTLRKNDVLIAISFVPYSVETIDLAAHARSVGTRVVAITDAAASPLRRLGTETLTVAEIDVGAFRPLAATLALAMTLAVAVGAKRRTREN